MWRRIITRRRKSRVWRRQLETACFQAETKRKLPAVNALIFW
jgi:hypothetical protein